MGKNLDKMNVMNFIKQKSTVSKANDQQQYLYDNGEYHKAINRQGSKKLI